MKIKNSILAGYLVLQCASVFALDDFWVYKGRMNGGSLVLNPRGNEIYIGDRSIDARFDLSGGVVGIYSSSLSFCISRGGDKLNWMCHGFEHKIVGRKRVDGDVVRVVEVRGPQKIILYYSLKRGVVAISDGVSASAEKMELEGLCGFPYVDADSRCVFKKR